MNLAPASAQKAGWVEAFKSFQSMSEIKKEALLTELASGRSPDDKMYFQSQKSSLLAMVKKMKIEGSSIHFAYEGNTYRISELDLMKKTYKLNGILLNPSDSIEVSTQIYEKSMHRKQVF